MSVLFNHACRYELFDRNPISLVRQGTKRRSPPIVLTPVEIKEVWIDCDIVDRLRLRERTLVLLPASTGLRQSELSGLKWLDVDFELRTMSVPRSILCGVVGPCKTESSEKPVPLDPNVADTLSKWKEKCRYRKAGDWVFASTRHRGRTPYWGPAILRKYTFSLSPARSASRSGSVGTLSATPTQPFSEALEQN